MKTGKSQEYMFKVIHNHLRGKDVGKITDEQEVWVRKNADGFGMSLCPSDEIFWDWSNVRDSTPHAINRMYLQPCAARKEAL